MDCTAHVCMNQPVRVIHGCISTCICCTGARSKWGSKLLARYLGIVGRRSIYSRRLYQFGMLLASPFSYLTATLLRRCLIIRKFTWNWSRFARHAWWCEGGADKSLVRPTSRCRRTESIVSLERGVCSCAELQDFSCYRGWKEACQVTRAISTTSRRELSSRIFFFCKTWRRRKFTPFWKKH